MVVYLYLMPSKYYFFKLFSLMIENCIGKISMPIGLALNFKINNKIYQIPMCIEEPSVVAAASSGGKFICEKGGGFTASST